MALFNHATKEVTAKLVYYGPGLCGKTTNLEWIHDNLSFRNKGKLVSLATESDRTLFFDFLPVELGTIRGMRTRMQIYTVPGQVFYEATRRMVLKGCDAVVFVADSQAAMLDANYESLESLKRNLLANEIDPAVPMVLQYNKRDLPTALPVSVLNARLNPRNLPFFEAVAFKGQGVEDTLRGVTKALFKWLSDYYGGSDREASTANDAIGTHDPDASTPAAGERVKVQVEEPQAGRPAPRVSTADPVTLPPVARKAPTPAPKPAAPPRPPATAPPKPEPPIAAPPPRPQAPPTPPPKPKPTPPSTPPVVAKPPAPAPPAPPPKPEPPIAATPPRPQAPPPPPPKPKPTPPSTPPVVAKPPAPTPPAPAPPPKPTPPSTPPVVAKPPAPAPPAPAPPPKPTPPSTPPTPPVRSTPPEPTLPGDDEPPETLIIGRPRPGASEPPAAAPPPEPTPPPAAPEPDLPEVSFLTEDDEPAPTIRIKKQRVVIPETPPASEAPPPAPPTPTPPPASAAPPEPAAAEPEEPIGVAPEEPLGVAPEGEPLGVAPEEPLGVAPEEPLGVAPEEPVGVAPDPEPVPAAPPTPPAPAVSPEPEPEPVPAAPPTPPAPSPQPAPPSDPAPAPAREAPETAVFRERAPKEPAEPPPMGDGLSAEQWLYLLNGSQKGPVDIEDLVDLVLTSIPEDTKVWHPGLEGWVRANDVREIAEEIPPPLPVPGVARGGYVEEDMPDFDTVPPQFRTALIADEDEGFRKYLAMPLAAQGFTIHEAADGSAAWQLAVQNRPWLILADVSMPEVDGFEFCRRVRTHPLLSHTPLLFISGSDKYKERYRALQIGADDFLSKQMPIRELLMRIQLLLTKYSDLSETQDAEKAEGETADIFQGRVEVFGAPALLQMCAQGKLSGLFTALAEDEDNTATTMGFRGGEIISATLGEQNGVDAVYAFLAWEKGSFKFTPGDAGSGEPLAQSVEHLLLEGCRLLDESQKDGGGTAAPF